ncbi:DUF421 domain-containing protein [Rossellomorea sp. YZS02]|uniref:DUF421 domain-containing protein n=1 Tax=Rossellomorea sp. YZS02 TaxID=3097358 RepID=UPI002A0ADA7A|nr:DUF421 domain-containing protein [Rossellomorea sp. YZS02]MDX8344613.1 DUF421 domain-containing protein [Rossellomorea sp. YZS02]
MSIAELFIRLLLSFVFLFVFTRLMGRKEISQMTFFNFVSAIALGTLGASLAIDSSISVRNGIIALAGWSIFTILMGYWDLKSKSFRSLVEGTPRVVVRKGEVLEGELKKLRLDIDALNVLLRKKNVFSIQDVDYAIMETDGTLSVMKKEGKQTVTKSDRLNPSLTTSHVIPIPTALIEDGNINDKNIEALPVDEQWLKQQLTTKGIHSISDVFYAEIQKDGTLHVDRYDDTVH